LPLGEVDEDAGSGGQFGETAGLNYLAVDEDDDAVGFR
jgi:hypothetical protein